MPPSTHNHNVPTLPFNPLHYFHFNSTATTDIYTLSLHDALPICPPRGRSRARHRALVAARGAGDSTRRRSEEHTSELQSQFHLVCRLLLEKKKYKVYRVLSPILKFHYVYGVN